MCVATLHVSTDACAHRWYQLVRPCDPANNLANCSEKLKLEGWESRTHNCPWCDDNTSESVHETTHRLFGSTLSTVPTASSSTTQELGFTRPHRSDSNGTLSSLSALSRHSSTASTESDRGERHRQMNERLHLYLNAYPHEVLPSAAKNYPTYPQVQPSENTSSDEPVLQRSDSALKRRWRKSVKLSRTMFNV